MRKVIDVVEKFSRMHTWGDPQLTPGARQQDEEKAAQLKITNYPCKRVGQGAGGVTGRRGPLHTRPHKTFWCVNRLRFGAKGARGVGG